MSGVQDWTLSANGNLTIQGFGDPGPISVAENCAAANLNNAVRAAMSDVMQELAYQGDISASVSMSLAGVGWRMSSVSGSASIIHVGTGRAGLVRILRWNSPSTLVGSANIITDGGGNIVTATNDVTTFTSFGGGAWRAVNAPASGINPSVPSNAQNMLINGGMQVNQRVVTASAQNDSYINDRFYLLLQTNSVTISQLSNPVNGVPSAVRLTQAQAVAQRMGVAQIVESVNCRNVRGQTVSSNWWVTSSTSQNIRYAILEWTGTADTVTSDVVLSWTSGTYTANNFFLASNLTVTAVGVAAVTAGTPTILPALTGTCGSSTNNLICFVWTESACAQNVTLDVSMAQCALGSSIGAFVWPQQPEVLLQCQRYFQKSFAQNIAPATGTGNQSALSGAQVVGASTANAGGLVCRLPVVMRGLFLPTLYNPSASNSQARNETTGTDCSSTSAGGAISGDMLYVTFTSPFGSAAGNRIIVHYALDDEL